MNRRVKLNRVNVTVLPPKVIKLLSQFAYYLKKHNGTVIKLSSKSVLQDVHDAYQTANDDVLDELYELIVEEVSSYSLSKSKSEIRGGKPKRILRLN